MGEGAYLKGQCPHVKVVRLTLHTFLLGEMVMKFVIGEISENFGKIFIISYFAKFTYKFTKFRITRKTPSLLFLQFFAVHFVYNF